jgi:hypothetical protein
MMGGGEYRTGTVRPWGALLDVIRVDDYALRRAARR